MDRARAAVVDQKQQQAAEQQQQPKLFEQPERRLRQLLHVDRADCGAQLGQAAIVDQLPRRGLWRGEAREINGEVSLNAIVALGWKGNADDLA